MALKHSEAAAEMLDAIDTFMAGKKADSRAAGVAGSGVQSRYLCRRRV